MAVFLLAPAVFAQQPEGLSLLNKPLIPSALKGKARQDAEAELAAARDAAAKDTTSADAALKLGHALEKTGHLTDAVEVYTLAIEQHADDASLLMARGQLLILIRKLEPAARDLRKAGEKIPDAHCGLGFVTYLRGDFAGAIVDFKGCHASPWLALAAARATHAVVPPPPLDDRVAADYYAAVPALMAGDHEHAREQLSAIVNKQASHWMEDAYIAAEADLARLPKKKRKQ